MMPAWRRRALLIAAGTVGALISYAVGSNYMSGGNVFALTALLSFCR